MCVLSSYNDCMHHSVVSSSSDTDKQDFDYPSSPEIIEDLVSLRLVRIACMYIQIVKHVTD